MPEKTLQIKTPYAKNFRDYHDIDYHAEDINEIVNGGELKAYECGHYDGIYIGLFYVGRRPSKAEIKKIVQRDCGYSKAELKEVTWSWRYWSDSDLEVASDA